MTIQYMSVSLVTSRGCLLFNDRLKKKWRGNPDCKAQTIKLTSEYIGQMIFLALLTEPLPVCLCQRLTVTKRTLQMGGIG